MDLSHYKGMASLSDRLPKLKMKTYKGRTLFAPEPNMSLLPNCPFCNRPLKKLMNRPLFLCSRKTCPATMDGKSFKISEDKMKKWNNT